MSTNDHPLKIEVTKLNAHVGNYYTIKSIGNFELEYYLKTFPNVVIIFLCVNFHVISKLGIIKSWNLNNKYELL